MPVIPPEIAVFFIFAAGLFVQSGAGFGSALVAMPLLISIIGAKTAAPLFAVSYMLIAIVITFRYRKDLRIENIWRIILASFCGIPIGILVISKWDEHVVLFILGVIVLAYAIYALLGFQPPRLKDRRWQFGLGFIGGMMSGAYNSSGPVYVVYGDSQRWSPFEFKGNLQALFFLNSITTTSTHFLVGNITPEVTRLMVVAIPGMLFGVLLGLSLDRFIKPEPFRKVVLGLLLLIAVNLMI